MFMLPYHDVFALACGIVDALGFNRELLALVKTYCTVIFLVNVQAQARFKLLCVFEQLPADAMRLGVLLHKDSLDVFVGKSDKPVNLVRSIVYVYVNFRLRQHVLDELKISRPILLGNKIMRLDVRFKPNLHHGR